MREPAVLGFFCGTGSTHAEDSCPAQSKTSLRNRACWLENNPSKNSISSRKALKHQHSGPNCSRVPARSTKLDLWSYAKIESGTWGKIFMENHSDSTPLDITKVRIVPAVIEKNRIQVRWATISREPGFGHRCNSNRMGFCLTPKGNTDDPFRFVPRCKGPHSRPGAKSSDTRNRLQLAVFTRKGGNFPSGQPSDILGADQRNKQTFPPKSTGHHLLGTRWGIGDSGRNHLDSVGPQCIRRLGISGSVLEPEATRFSKFTQDILRNWLAPSTRRNYDHVLKRFRVSCQVYNPLDPENWFVWLQSELHRNAATTVAQYIKSAQAALTIQGIDLSVLNPLLNNRLNHLAVRFRSWGTKNRKSIKNTDLDKKKVIGLKNIKSSLMLHLDETTTAGLQNVAKYEDIMALDIPKSLLRSYVMCIVAYLGGLRKSDIMKTIVTNITPSSVTLKLFNLKCSSPLFKEKRSFSLMEAENLRYRSVKLNAMSSPDCPVLWIRALYETYGAKSLPCWLFGSRDNRSLGDLTAVLAVKLLNIEKSYMHMFRVSHASIARAAKIPDSEIMKRVDWASTSIIDRYARTTTPIQMWDACKDYQRCLGFGHSFKV